MLWSAEVKVEPGCREEEGLVVLVFVFEGAQNGDGSVCIFGAAVEEAKDKILGFPFAFETSSEIDGGETVGC